MHYFPAVQQIEGVNWQKVAVATALKQPFCLITGGPGTGKPLLSHVYSWRYRHFLRVSLRLS